MLTTRPEAAFFRYQPCSPPYRAPILLSPTPRKSACRAAASSLVELGMSVIAADGRSWDTQRRGRPSCATVAWVTYWHPRRCREPRGARALEQGVPDAHVAELLGHASTAMIHRHHGHLAAKARASLEVVRPCINSGRLHTSRTIHPGSSVDGTVCPATASCSVKHVGVPGSNVQRVQRVQ
jgi:hypothetical protein